MRQISKTVAALLVAALVLGVMPLPAGVAAGAADTLYVAVLERLSKGAGARRPTFSPDGSRIAYQGDGGLWVMDADGDNRELVYEAWARMPSWGPPVGEYFGGLIAFAGNGITIVTPEGELVKSIDTAGTGPYPPDPGRGADGTTNDVSWSADGSRLAFSTSMGTSAVWTVDFETGEDFTQITDYSKTAYGATWSPSGNEIACNWGPSSDMKIAVFEADGSETSPDREIAYGSSPSWSADGIAFVNGSELWVVEPDGGDMHKAYAGPGQSPVWSPDRSQLVFLDAMGGDVYRIPYLGGCVYTGIQDAVDAADQGDTIRVTAGTYDENVTVETPDLTLCGPNVGTPGQSPDRGEEAVILGTLKAAGGTTIDGFRIETDGHGVNAYGPATIKNCVLLGQQPPTETYQGGVFSSGTRALVVEDNLIEGFKSGIYLDGGKGSQPPCTFEGNLITRNGTGISTNGSIWESAGHVIRGNRIEANEVNGIVLAGRKVALVDTGLGTGFRVEENVILDNGGHGISAGWGTSHTSHEDVIERNLISGNGGLGLNNRYTGTGQFVVDASFNYWGDPSGPSGEAPGDGDEVSANVTYSPWYISDAMSLRSDRLKLEVTVSGSGHVTVKPEPVLVDGEEYYSYGVVTLSAAPAAGHEFSSWSGDVDAKTSSATTVLMDWHKSARAVFIKKAPAPQEPEPEVLASVASEVDPDEGGSLTLPDETINLAVPAGATEGVTTFSVSELDADDAPEVPGTLTVAGKVVQITAEDAAGNPVREFGAPLTITFQLTEEDVDGDWEDLAIMFYDEDLGWIALETTVDPETGTVTATFDHLTVFAVMRVSVPAVEYGAREVVMVVGETTYTADHELREMDVAPFIENDRTFVPVRFLAEAFGAEADWDPKDALVETVTLTRPDITITIEIGSMQIEVEEDGEVTYVESDVAAFIREGRTMLPYRVIAEAFGATVDYGPLDGPVEWVSFEQ